MPDHSRYYAPVLLAALISSLVAPAAQAAVEILGVQYKPDYYFPEYNCYWNASAYPGPCRVPVFGATVQVFLRNTGPGNVTINDANLTTTAATYSLKTILKRSTDSIINPQGLNSIFFYWDNPPADVFDAGEPVWVRFDPATLPVNGVAQVALRLRTAPVGDTVKLQVLTSGGNVSTNVPVTLDPPRVTSMSWSDDRKQIYVHWRRTPGQPGGAAPTVVRLNGTNVTTLTTTVGDPALNFAASVINLPQAVPHFSAHVIQGIYDDGQIATAAQRAWTNKFIYSTYCRFESYTCAQWLQEALTHGFNNIQMNLCGMCLDNSITSTGYGYTIMEKDKLNSADPDMWFLDDEPDIGENNQVANQCGPGLRIPCGTYHAPGTLVMKRLDDAADLRTARPNVPTTVNLNGALEPESFFTWGGAVDILQTDNYYEPRLKDSYLSQPTRYPLFKRAHFSYAVARTASAAAQPNPSNHLLYSTRQTSGPWPFPWPQSKRFEVYYSLAGGSKGMGYWWLKSPNGLNNTETAARALWKEMGLCGNEIKTARNLIIHSTPVDLPITASTNVWARAVASGVDTLLLYVANDNYYNDNTACHYTPVPNATLTFTPPAWMQPATTPTAFEITSGGIRPVTVQPNAGQWHLPLGTLTLTRMIVLTRDPQLLPAIQQRYEQAVRPNVCSFAPEVCTNAPLQITGQPSPQSVPVGGTATFTVAAFGNGINYQWQKLQTNLVNGGRFSGCTSATLSITSCVTNDAASYRCVITSTNGSATSSNALLTVTTDLPAIPTALPATGVASNAFLANWAAAAGATGYRLDVSSNVTFATFISGHQNLDVSNSLIRLISGLNASRTYYYRVRAYNGTGTSTNSNIITVTTLVGPPPPPPAPVAAPATSVTESGFTANWNSANWATGYRMDVSLNSGFNTFVSGYQNLDVGDVWNWNVGGLFAGTNFYYRVRAYNSSGTSAYSATITVPMPPPRPDPCFGLANAGFENGFTLAGGGFIANGWTEWEASPGVTIGYDETGLVRNGGHAQRIRVSSTGATSGGVFQRIPAVPGRSYTVSVWIYAGDDQSACSLGVDRYGGTNALSSSVLWSTTTTNVAWVQKSLTVTAFSNQLTVFYRVGSADNNRRNGYFDDATPEAVGGTLHLTAQRSSADAGITLIWPECPPAQLQSADSPTSPAYWTAVTNPIQSSGGFKSVTLLPDSGGSASGFYRLVAE